MISQTKEIKETNVVQEKESLVGMPVLVNHLEGELKGGSYFGDLNLSNLPYEVCTVGIVLKEDEDYVYLLKEMSHKKKDIAIIDKSRIIKTRIVR